MIELAKSERWSVGVDTGGTFTDVYAVEAATGRTVLAKTPSTPDEPSRAILNGFRQLRDLHDVTLSDTASFAHGTTVGTNALIQRSGERTALIVTRGFRDLPVIGRQTRPDIFDLQRDAPPPLAGDDLRFEVTERVTADGAVRTPLALDEVPGLAQAITASGAHSVAICLLFSFLNPAHEIALRDALARVLPNLRISISSDVQPEFREFERLNTTLINAYLQPVMDAYIDRLREGVAELAPDAEMGINQSNGGLMSASVARNFPVRTALSGPAAGAVGAAYTARQTGHRHILTVDVGGTSADVALIRDWRPSIARERDVAGFPIRLPMVDIETIGAGGGSIAWFDIDGLMKVGPQSAGARPGPACYGHGGTEPTVSDANLILHRLSPELADGGLKMREDLAQEALAPLAARLDTSLEEAARAILSIAVANMVRALRSISVERGHDPSEFALMAFGGAGPLHARDIAAELGMTEIVIPAAPGIVCAQGLLVAEKREDISITHRMPVEEAAATALNYVVKALDKDAEHWFADLSVVDGRKELIIEARFVGQNFEIQVPSGTFLQGTCAEVLRVSDFRTAFLQEHIQAYGYANEQAPIEIVNIRLTALAAGHVSSTAEIPTRDDAGPSATRRVWFDGEAPVDTEIWNRKDLSFGQVLTGPAIVEQLDTTIPIYPGDQAHVDAYGNVVISIGGALS